MYRKLTVIGATGKLAVPIIKRLQENSVDVTAIVRDVAKAQSVLPTGVEILAADLSDKDSLQSALQGTEYLYLNLSAGKYEDDFVPEIDGVRNVVEVAKKTPIKQILKISGIGALHPEFNVKGEIYEANKLRSVGHPILKESGIAYTIFHPSWFLNSLPWFIKDNKFMVYGKDENPFYWTNTTDFADQLTAAIGNTQAYNREFAVQGNKALTFEQAGKCFLEITNPEIQIEKQIIKKEMGAFGKLLSYYENFQEKFVADKTWALLGEPRTTLEEFFYSQQK